MIGFTHRPCFGSQQGFTLLELLQVIGLLAIILGLAVPSVQSYYDTQRLIDAARSGMNLIVLAREDSALRKRDVAVSFDEDDWCIGVTTNASCDCGVANVGTVNACAVNAFGVNALQVLLDTNYANVSLVDADFGGDTNLSFTAARGIAEEGSVDFQGSNGDVLRILVSTMGSVSICSPAGNNQVTGYLTC